MSDALKAHFTRLFGYEARCTPLVIESLRASKAKIEEVGLAALVAPYERAVAVFCHTLAARQLWLSRISKHAEFPADGVFPVWSLEKAERESRIIERMWSEYFEGLDQSALSHIVKYTSTEGIVYESVLADVLTHVVNHSSYHRGQIALLIAQTGVRPAVTDFIALTREKA